LNDFSDFPQDALRDPAVSPLGGDFELNSSEMNSNLAQATRVVSGKG
jgi:hypothetical protein